MGQPSTGTTVTDQWWRRGACYQTFDLRFFGSDTERAQVRVEYCLECCVVKQCYVKGLGEKTGVWGAKPRRRRL